MYDRAFTCEICKFWLHPECALISHPSHSQHPLQLIYEDKHCCCNGCSGLSRNWLYRCQRCDFNLDLSCASSTTIPTPIDKEINHFCHHHTLTQFNYRKVSKYHPSCFWCVKLLSGICYVCLQCDSLRLCIHESCLINMPTVITEHPFHPSHPLYIIASSESVRCFACTSYHTMIYSCKKCRFHFCVHCTNLKPSLKHELHQHHLTLFPIIKSHRINEPCKKCDISIYLNPLDEIKLFYRCLECDSSFHFRGLIHESSAKHEYHRHELILTDFFVEDFSDQYYCDICEQERVPQHPVYCCKKSRFVAHIGCALTEIKDYHGSASSLVGGKGTSIGKLMEQDERNAESKIEYFDHEHPLCFKKVAEQNGSAICKACFLEISDEAYACKSCKYYMHKTCTNLPWEVLHPLHPHHSLKLLSEVRGKVFSCDGCRDVTAGFAYACSMCGFMLDVKCALLRVPKIETQRLKEMEERRPKSCLFNKAYQLSFFNIKAIFDECCSFCQRYVKGPAYSCSDCDMKLQFHPLHPFHSLLDNSSKICHLCKREIWYDICYSCVQCDLHLHASCAKSLKRVLKSTSHIHNFIILDQILRPRALNTRCKNVENAEKCYVPILSVSVWNVIPSCMLNVLCHLHSNPTSILALLSLVLDSGQNYCDICEEERDPEDHVYYCTECINAF
ncbi:hypothetical protein ES319_D13G197500v1 [Gossypium barbadense]|uniref:Phorbol-ester/DAG-type domain-containing protein n=2 Tax=Gossypium TaxID=3633 RepID=A0A5J5NNW5_GOSBA|nr:hypothetical protein ES319_D13G197500v1 [Gossypium barbadense]TYG38284.1 hypothetical protein ES288_D13G209500v1 [Gossypium darwinii]